jgi:hypothetical protein
MGRYDSFTTLNFNKPQKEPPAQPFEFNFEINIMKCQGTATTVSFLTVVLFAYQFVQNAYNDPQKNDLPMTIIILFGLLFSIYGTIVIKIRHSIGLIIYSIFTLLYFCLELSVLILDFEGLNKYALDSMDSCLADRTVKEGNCQSIVNMSILTLSIFMIVYIALKVLSY